MKRIIVSVALLAVGYGANAQIKSNQPIKSDINGSNAFLDGSTSFSIKSNDNKTGKGLVFPDTDLTSFEFDLSLADGQTFPTWFNGMVVYNIGTGKTGTNTNKQGIQVDVTPGFYYFSNPNGATTQSVKQGKWVRLGGDDTNTGLWVKQSNGDIELVDSNLLNTVKYKPNGGYISFPNDITNRTDFTWDNNNRTILSSNFLSDDYNNEGNFFNIKGFADKLPNQVYGTPNNLSKNMSNNVLYIDNLETSNIGGFVSTRSAIKINGNSTKNYQQAYASTNYSQHFGTGKVNMMIGNVAASQLFPNSSATRMVGAYNEVNNKSKNRTEVIEGTYSYVVAENEGFIQDAFGSRNQLKITKESTGTINWLEGSRNLLNIDSEYTGTINNYTGTRIYSPNIANGITGKVKNMYGIFIGNINKGSEKNYALYTEEGKVRFGDNVGIGVNNPQEKLEVAGKIKSSALSGTGDRMVVADQNGVLKTSQFVMKATDTTDGCSASNAGAIHYKEVDRGGKKVGVFGFCTRDAQGNYKWAYNVGGNNVFDGTGAFGSGL